MKTFIVEVADEFKVGFVETLVSQLDGVAYKEKQESKTVNKKNTKSVAETFSNTFVMWKGKRH